MTDSAFVPACIVLLAGPAAFIWLAVRGASKARVARQLVARMRCGDPLTEVERMVFRQRGLSQEEIASIELETLSGIPQSERPTWPEQARSIPVAAAPPATGRSAPPEPPSAGDSGETEATAPAPDSPAVLDPNEIELLLGSDDEDDE